MIDTYYDGGRNAGGIVLGGVPDRRATLPGIRKMAMVPPTLGIVRPSSAGQKQGCNEEAWT
jgi:hypothetical protein